MSLFVAVRLPDVAVADLAATHSALPPELAATRPELRWVPPQNWHLTLAFLGQVGTERMADLETRLARAAGRRGPLTLWLAGPATSGRGCCSWGWAVMSSGWASSRRVWPRPLAGPRCRSTIVPTVRT